MSIIYFIIVLGITILVHELGHFIFAKKAKVHIYEFSLGMGPQIFKFKRKNDETIYSIRLFPIGGFVSMAGEDIENDNEIPKDKQLCNKKWTERFLVMIAGIAFNFILAIILLFVVGLVSGVSPSKPVIGSLDENYPIHNSNIVVGDQIVEVNNHTINSTDMLLLDLARFNGKKINIKVKHENGKIEVVSIKPTLVEKNDKKSYLYGFTLDNTKTHGLVPALKYGFRKTVNLVEQMSMTIFYLIKGDLSIKNLAGPLGIYKIVDGAAAAGLINIIYLIAYLCINVGFINFIPFPAFDGGRILFLFIELIKGSKVNPKVENMIHTIGFIFLMILMAFITFNDITRFFN